MTPIQARQLVDMQVAFNQVIDPSYPAHPKVKRDDVKAILVELGEYFEHTAYKWWKKQSADWNQANMELIDILHFAISDAVEHAVEHAFDAEDDVETALQQVAEMVYQSFQEPEAVNDGKDLVMALALDGGATQKLVCGKTFFSALAGMLVVAYGDADTVYLTYVGKNALNKLRQERGYKQGTYIKMWNDEEDNEVMMRILAEQNQVIIGADKPLHFAFTLLLNHYDSEVR